MYLGLQPFPDAAAAPEEAEPPHLAAEEGEEAPAGCPDARRLMQWAPHTLAAHFGRSLAIDDDDVSEINKYLNYAVTILPVVLALGITIAGRMAWRDKWSVCTMCADTILAEIYKFRMQTCEYDQNKPPGKDSDGNDLPPLTQKEKSRRARMLFVERVQAFQSACFTELSQTTALKLTRILRSKKVAPTASLIARATSEEKPTLAQWYKLKCHIEQHCYRTAWAFPQGVSFLNWISALRPYLSQRTMSEEMKDTILSLGESGQVTLDGTQPLSERESTLVRQTLATRLALSPKQLDNVKDDIRYLQRKVVLQMAEEAASQAEKASGSRPTSPGVVPSAGATRVTAVSPSTPQSTSQPADISMVREMMMELQGRGKPVKDEGEVLKRIRKKQKKLMEVKPSLVEDDYLCGPMAVDTYMCYRVRPTIARIQRKVSKLAWRLSALEVVGFFVQASGSVFAVFYYTEWVALTVAVAAVLQGFIEFMALRDQVTSCNLALRDLQGLIIMWDSLSIVRRRTPAVKMQIVSAAEEAILMIVQEKTTATSNTITSVAKQMEAAAEMEAATEGES